MPGRISPYVYRLRMLFAAALLVSVPLHSAAKDKRFKLNREAKLYRMPTGDVFTARYHLDGRGKGQMQIDLSAPQVLSGESVPVKNGDGRWGQLFRAVGDPVKLNGLQRGLIFAEGGGMSIQCEYVTTASVAGGYGFCKDNHDAMYRLLF
jgi:hypothetical protein